MISIERMSRWILASTGAAALALACGCTSVEVSGFINYRNTIGTSRADGYWKNEVYGFGYTSRAWDETEPIPQGRARIVIVRPDSAGDGGAGYIFRINGKGDFILGTGNVLAWHQPAGPLEIRFDSYLLLNDDEYDFPGEDLAPFALDVEEGSTCYLRCSSGSRGRAPIPVLTIVGRDEALEILAREKLKKFALTRNIEDEIPDRPEGESTPDS